MTMDTALKIFTLMDRSSDAWGGTERLNAIANGSNAGGENART